MIAKIACGKDPNRCMECRQCVSPSVKLYCIVCKLPLGCNACGLSFNCYTCGRTCFNCAGECSNAYCHQKRCLKCQPSTQDPETGEPVGFCYKCDLMNYEEGDRDEDEDSNSAEEHFLASEGEE